MWIKLRKQKQLKALTLTELLVVMVIIGILILLALPNLMPVVAQARAQEAKTNLAALRSSQQIFFMENANYANDITQISFEPPKLKSEGGTAMYRYEIVNASNSGFVARATAEVDFDQDGNINVWEIDQNNNLVEKVKD